MTTRVFVYEHLTSAGFVGLPESLAREGRAMLAAVLADFDRCDGVEVVTLGGEPNPLTPFPEREGEPDTSPVRLPLPFRGGGWGVGSASHRLRGKGEPEASERSFRAAARRSDFALVIAPEFDDLLARRCEWAEEEGCRLLGPSVGAVRLTADKLELAAHLTRAGVPTIPTLPSTRTPPWPPPYVCKPRFGAGSQDTFLVSNLDDFPAHPNMLVQPYLAPRHGALSLACIGGTPLVLMRQTLSDDGRFRYLGGERALDVADAPYRELARMAIEAVPGLEGYVGIDLLWPVGEDRPVVVEINPRLTTSYVGLRALCEGNLMQTLLDGVQGRAVEPTVFRAGPIRFMCDGAITS